MRFWDSGIAGLAAVGIKVSEAEQQVLEGGGEVLFIHNLLSPWHWDGDFNPMLDQDEKIIYVPNILIATHPSQQYLPIRKMGDDTVAIALDSEWGSEWRSWPSYVGTIDERFATMREALGGITYVRVWDGTVLSTALDHVRAETVIHAAHRRIDDSAYEAFCVVYEFTASTEFDVDDLEVIEAEGVVEEDVYDDYDPDYIRGVVAAWRFLVDGCYLLPAKPTRVQRKHLRPLYLKPMSDYLGDSPEALHMWDRLVARRENTTIIIANAFPAYISSQFKTKERERQ